MSDNVLEFNGKRYDAVTGAYLGKSHVVPAHIRASFAQGKAIDGFVRQQTKKPAATPKVTEAATPPNAKTGVQQIKSRIVVRSSKNETHAQANHLRAHRPERSKTLMRRSIKKPQFTMKTAISKAHAPAEIAAKPASALARKHSVYSVDVSRQARAERTHKHPAIQHFNTAVHSVSAQVPVIAVQPAPLQLHTQEQPRPQPVAPPVRHHGHNHNDIFEKAMARATSHLEPEHKVRTRRSRKRRLANALAVTAAFLVIGGFVGYLNLPGIEMRVASIQAGFEASLPTHVPTGYSLAGKVERSGDTISVSFRSGASQYRITQQPSNWNSQTLLDDTLALDGRHQTVQKNGQTIYIYQDGGTNAVWVNGGIRYDLTGNAELSQDEVIAIATSM